MYADLVKKNKKLQDFHHARHPDQLRKMKEIAERGICHLCPKYLEEYHDYPIEKIGRYWAITKNDYPYQGANLHYLFIHRKHIEHITQITAQAWTELTIHFKWLANKYNLPGGGFFIRFGDSRYTGATASHLHGHLLIGVQRKGKEKQKIINVPLGYQKK